MTPHPDPMVPKCMDCGSPDLATLGVRLCSGCLVRRKEPQYPYPHPDPMVQRGRERLAREEALRVFACGDYGPDLTGITFGADTQVAPGLVPPGTPNTLGNLSASMTAEAHAQRRQPQRPPRRLASCVARWPGCDEGLYDPRCHRFPKTCSCTVYDPERISEADLEPDAQRRQP